MTIDTTYRLLYSGYIPSKDITPSYFNSGAKAYDSGDYWASNPLGYHIPPIGGKLLEKIRADYYLGHLKDIEVGEHFVLVLRQDQMEGFEKQLEKFKKEFGFGLELVHKSPDFTNLNYLAGNYLNLYIYKVTKNDSL